MTTLTDIQPDGSVYDAIYLAVAERTDMPFEEVRAALLHTALPDDSFWFAWDETVAQAVRQFNATPIERKT